MVDLFPEPFDLVYFHAATAFVTDSKKVGGKKPVGGATSKHRASPIIKLGAGYIFIDRKWCLESDKKAKLLSPNEMKKWKKDRKKK